MTTEAFHPAHAYGHRSIVGGTDEWHWREIGRLQFEFLLGRGLRPTHCFLDAGCGCLRAGVHLIPFLHTGNYLGLDKQVELVLYGVADELGIEMYRQKQPGFVISQVFEFEKFGRRPPDFGIAQSVFTHLDDQQIRLCLRNLAAWATEGCRFYASFRELPVSQINPVAPEQYAYTREEMETLGRESGWSPTYIGDWGHPRGQMMMEYRL